MTYDSTWQRVQTINLPGSEVGPGVAGAVATWGKAIAGNEMVGQASIFHLNGVAHKFPSLLL
jgi:hypothetical protein